MPIDSTQVGQSNQYRRTGLLILAVLQILMLSSLFTLTEPHPPLRIAPFALAPFISASIALAIAGYMQAPGRLANGLSVAACLTALVSYGPHKWFDAAIGDIWPAVMLAQLSAIAVLYAVFAQRKNEGDQS